MQPSDFSHMRLFFLFRLSVEPLIEPTPCTLGDIRLVDGSSEREGRVEVCLGDIWSPVSKSSWDNRDAGVVCKQLFNSSFGKCIQSLAS